MKWKTLPPNVLKIKRKFAFFPIECDDGITVWLGFVHKVSKMKHDLSCKYYFALPPLGKTYGEYIEFEELWEKVLNPEIPLPPKFARSLESD